MTTNMIPIKTEPNYNNRHISKEKNSNVQELYVKGHLS